jgi:hypothetical protein
MPDNDLVRVICPQCDQRIALPRDNPAVEIGCPKCDVGIRLDRTDDGDIAGAELFAPVESQPSVGTGRVNLMQRIRPHTGKLFLLFVVLGIYFIGVPHLMYRWTLKKAEKGDVAAQVELGLRYEKGDGTWQDFTKAIHWYATAAHKGDLNAMFLIHGGLMSQREQSSSRINIAERNAREGRKVLAELMSKRWPMEEHIRQNIRLDPLAEAFLTSHAKRGSSIALVHLATGNPFDLRCLPSDYVDRVNDGDLPEFLRTSKKERPFEKDRVSEFAYQNVLGAIKRVVALEEKEGKQ